VHCLKKLHCSNQGQNYKKSSKECVKIMLALKVWVIFRLLITITLQMQLTLILEKIGDIYRHMLPGECRRYNVPNCQNLQTWKHQSKYNTNIICTFSTISLLCWIHSIKCDIFNKPDTLSECIWRTSIGPCYC
jgi:Fe2+ transport system protein B